MLTVTSDDPCHSEAAAADTTIDTLLVAKHNECAWEEISLENLGVDGLFLAVGLQVIPL